MWSNLCSDSRWVNVDVFLMEIIANEGWMRLSRLVDYFCACLDWFVFIYVQVHNSYRARNRSRPPSSDWDNYFWICRYMNLLLISRLIDYVSNSVLLVICAGTYIKVDDGICKQQRSYYMCRYILIACCFLLLGEEKKRSLLLFEFCLSAGFCVLDFSQTGSSVVLFVLIALTPVCHFHPFGGFLFVVVGTRGSTGFRNSRGRIFELNSKYENYLKISMIFLLRAIFGPADFLCFCKAYGPTSVSNSFYDFWHECFREICV